MSQIAEQRRAIARLHAELNTVGTFAEMKEDFEGDLYLSIPTGGYHEALEIETYAVDADRIFFTLTMRSWDRTGGMSSEEEIAETNKMYLVLALVKAQTEWLRNEAAKLDALMSSSE